MYKKCVLHVRSCFAEKKPAAFLLPSLSSDLKVPNEDAEKPFSAFAGPKPFSTDDLNE